MPELDEKKRGVGKDAHEASKSGKGKKKKRKKSSTSPHNEPTIESNIGLLADSGAEWDSAALNNAVMDDLILHDAALDSSIFEGASADFVDAAFEEESGDFNAVEAVTQVERSDPKQGEPGGPGGEGAAAPFSPGSGQNVVPVPNLKRKKKFPVKKIIIGIVLLIVVAFIIRSCFFQGNQTAAADYTEVIAERRDLTVTLDGTGTLEAADSATVSVLVTGKIKSTKFEEGDLVSKDDVLLELDSADIQNTIERSELALSGAKDSYNQLLDSKDDLTISSTASGVIQTLLIDVGDSVTAGTPVATISDRSYMLLKVPFFSSDANSIGIGASAQITVDGTFETLYGTVDSVSALEEVGAGGTVVREVTIRVANPGALTPETRATATIGDVACSDSGTFSYLTEKTVTAKSTGEVGSLSVKEGDQVSSGQTLAMLKSDSIDSQIRSAERSVEDARLALQNAQKQLDNYVIKAPISGTLVQVDCAPGDAVAPSTPLMTIYDLSYLTFDMNVDELDITMVEVGQEVEVTADALPNDTFKGIVESISMVGVTAGGVTAYPVTIRLEDAGDLMPGMNVNANINIGTYENVLTVPIDAVTRGNTVLVSSDSSSAVGGEEGEVEGFSRITIGLGANDDDYIIVADGLKDGDTLAIVNQSGSSMWDMMMPDGNGSDSSSDSTGSGENGETGESSGAGEN